MIDSKKEFSELLGNELLVASGAMGTMIYSFGVPKGHCYDELNISSPDIIKSIHNAYIEAGADIVQTNTFGANRFILDKYYDLGDKTSEINRAGVMIAREVMESDGVHAFLGGSVGPITRPYESMEAPDNAQIYQYFYEQIEVLIDSGVDLIIMETMADLEELIIGIKAMREISKTTPIVAEMSFMEGYKTLVGVDAITVAERLSAEDVQCIGTNCGRGPQDAYEAIKRMASATKLPLSVMPNAGLPSFVGGKFSYPATPEYFKNYARRYRNIGVSIIGGCCGTAPEHIQAVAETVKGKAVKPTKTRGKIAVKKEVQPAAPKHPPSPFRSKLKDDFVITMEIDPPRGAEMSKELEAAKLFRAIGGDAINISDAPLAQLRMSALPFAIKIKQTTDIDIVLHYTCRDRNTLAITADFIGAYSMGLDNILALHGDPPSVGDYPFATSVFEITTSGLVNILEELNRGENGLGNKLPTKADFFVGVALNVNANNLDAELKRLDTKLEAGADFIQTQPVYDTAIIRDISARISVPEIPIIVSVLPLASSRHAEFLHNEVPGINIPRWIRAQLKDAGKNSYDKSIEICSALIKELKETCNGVCFMPPFQKYELVKDILDYDQSA